LCPKRDSESREEILRVAVVGQVILWKNGGG